MILLAMFASISVWGQEVIDTTDIYKDRLDSLEATVFTSRQAGNYLSKVTPVRTEVITAAGLCKMACCNLAESFENSASVTVGFSDAVTGARQIRLLGLSGIYTQMLDENRPIMRGLSAPFGLSYVPGQWLNSIQIAKGASSVINGVESMTGQINLEHRKPTDEKPLFLNAALMSDAKADFNIASSLQMGYKWSTVLLGHVSGNFKTHDMNEDGFMDDPRMLQFNFSNRWLYMADNGAQLRFGLRAINDSRNGGQEGYDKDGYDFTMDADGNYKPWGSDILNRNYSAYVKAGFPLNEDNSQNIALVADYTLHDMDSYFGMTEYLGEQHSLFANLLYMNNVNDSNKFTLGLSSTVDRLNEEFTRIVMAADKYTSSDPISNLMNVGVFGEYTYILGDKFTGILGLRGEWYGQDGMTFSPRVNLKYSPISEIVIRANGGRGLRYSMPLIDNLGALSTGKVFKGNFEEHVLEDSWTFGGNMTYYLPIGSGSSSYLSFDYFRTQFTQQHIVDYEHYLNTIEFYNLDGGRSFTDNYQLDFTVDPFPGFNVTTTFRYTDAKVEFAGRGLVEKPMTSRFKGVLNLQYSSNLGKWIFDFTASINGSSRVYDFMKDLKDEDGNLLYANGRTPVYPMLYAQVTRRFRGVDVYIGGENLTNFTQKNVILGSKTADGKVNPIAPSFDASAIWGPLMGAKFHVGFRFTLWK